ncbi:MAG TPA: P-II family nitrogen regulator [Armatimonadota bacterium]|jgi:nitrogen regulatory protein P-II 1
MKKIEAIIRPHKLDAVKDALHEIGVTGLTASDVKGFGRQKGQTSTYRTAAMQVDFVPKIKVEVVVDDRIAPQVVETVCDAANDGQIGAGKIFVSNLEEVVRIRTGERGPDAI